MQPEPVTAGGNVKHFNCPAGDLDGKTREEIEAHIAEAHGAATAKPPTKAELVARAEELGIADAAKHKVAELVELIAAAEAAAADDDSDDDDTND